MTVVFKEELLRDCLEELKPLLEEHYKEVALYQDKVKLNPDYDRYLMLEDAGNLHTVVAREDGKVVGYYISLVVEHLHYADTVYAHNDVVYLEPGLRHSRVALDMINFAIEKLKEKGVSVVTIHMKTYLPFEDRDWETRECLSPGSRYTTSL